MKPRLVMTLLVRDEVDIVEKNICFHLSHGVDFIVATDNGSTDGTLDILKKYKKKGVLDLIEEKKHTYEQSKWVSTMAKLAVKKHKATHLFHCDADEFWYPSSGDLKSELPKKGFIYLVSLINYLPDNLLFIPLSKKLIVSKPYSRIAQRGQDASFRLLMYTYPPKILTSKEYTNVLQGNHGVNSKTDIKYVNINNVFIHHFPVRSYRQFLRKVKNGGSSYANNKDKNPDMGWHWKEWYSLYNMGLLKEVYKTMCISRSERKVLLNQGVLKRIRVPKSILYAAVRKRLGIP